MCYIMEQNSNNFLLLSGSPLSTTSNPTDSIDRFSLPPYNPNNSPRSAEELLKHAKVFWKPGSACKKTSKYSQQMNIKFKQVIKQKAVKQYEGLSKKNNKKDDVKQI